MPHPYSYEEILLDSRRRASPVGLGPVRILHLWGQSNAAGEATSAGLSEPYTSPLYTCPAWYRFTSSSKVESTATMDHLRVVDSLIGTEVRLLRDVASRGYNALYQSARGGSSLYNDGVAANHWTPNVVGSQYELSITGATSFRNALQARMLGVTTITHDCVVWIQGEEDAKFEGPSNAYQVNLETLIAEARIDLNNPTLSFVLVHVNPLIAGGRTYLATVNAAMDAIAATDDNVYVVDASGLTTSDGVHYDQTSYLTLASRISAVVP